MRVYVNIVACFIIIIIIIMIIIIKKKETLWKSGKYIKKNWRAAGLELTTRGISRTIVTDGNC